MLNSGIMEEDPKWMRTATEEQLREFVKILDANGKHPRYNLLATAFAKECNRRAAEDYESTNGGEWI